MRIADLSEGGGVTLLGEVADIGPVTDDLLAITFDPFVTTKPHGTGVDLAICRGLVDAHNARLTALNNVEHHGCMFTVGGIVASGRPARIAP